MKQVAKHHRNDLRSLFEEYIRECKYTRGRSSETIRGYIQVFETFMKLSPTASLETLSPKLLTDFFSVLETRKRIISRDIEKVGVKKSTIVTYISKMHSFFKWLEDRGHIKENPVSKLARVTATYDDSKSLSKMEINKLRAAVESRLTNLLEMKRDRAIISVLLFCGIRRGELLGLRVMDVDLEKRRLTVKAETSKSKRTRILPLNQQVLIHLEDYMLERSRKQNKQKQHFYTTPQLFVALNRDGGLSKDGLKHWVMRLRQSSGTRFHLHQFRHTFACNLATNRVNAILLQQLLGHTDLRMTQRYVRSINADDLRPAVDSLSFDNLA